MVKAPEIEIFCENINKFYCKSLVLIHIIYYKSKNFPLLKKRWPDVVKHLMIDFDWPVRNRRENSQLPLDLNF